jgi:7-keto-8-aminopelargonate synthetase-like enzyme
LESIAVALEKSVHFAKKCIATTKKVKKNSLSPKLLKELDQNEKELMHHIKQARFISIPNQAQIMNVVSESSNIYDMNAILDFALPLYKATVDTSAIALPLVKNNIKELTKYLDQRV